MPFSRRVFLASSGAVALADSRSWLSSQFPEAKLAGLLRGEWSPYPRERWEGLPGAQKQELIAAGEAHAGTKWATLPATLFLEFARNGNRSRYEAVRSERREKLRELVMAECAERKGRFLDEIANGIWLTCEETYWGLPAHVGVQKAGKGLPDAAEPTVDLFAAETASLLAWTDHLLGSDLKRVSKLIPERVRMEIQRRVLKPCLERDDFGWMGLGPHFGKRVNNWNPWINSNWLTSVLLVEENEKRRVAAVSKILRSLDRFLASYHPDGGCDEGPSYWGRAGGSLFDCLELLYAATGGRMDSYSMPLVKEIGRYIYRAHIVDEWYTNFGDASARQRIAGDLVFRYGRRIGDTAMQQLGALAETQHPTSRDSIGRQLEAVFGREAIGRAEKRQPFVRDVWLPGTQVMMARWRGGSAEGMYLAAQGGHNAESHNHNDVGNFLLFSDGRPVFIDAGVETYTAKTFSSQRYEIWTMQSGYHNLPTIGGVMQAPGEQYRATGLRYAADEGSTELSMDIAQAYPSEAGVKSWRRTLRLDRRSNEVTVEDECDLSKRQAAIEFTLMTWDRPDISQAGAIEVAGARATYENLEPRVEEIAIRDGRLRSTWGDRLYRVLLRAGDPGLRGRWVLRVKKG